MSLWYQGVSTSLLGTRLWFWSRGWVQGSALSHRVNPRQYPQLTALFTHALTLSTVRIRLRRKKPQRIRNRTLDFPTRRTTVGPLHHRDVAVVFTNCVKGKKQYVRTCLLSRTHIWNLSTCMRKKAGRARARLPTLALIVTDGKPHS